MAKRKIIEDSDEDGDDHSPTKQLETGDNEIANGADGFVPLQPVKVKLNDVVNGDEMGWTSEWHRSPTRSISMSQPNAPPVSNSAAKKRWGAKTLTDMKTSADSTPNPQSFEGKKSFQSEEIFEFHGEDSEVEEGPKKKRRRAQSLGEDRVGHSSPNNLRAASRRSVAGTQVSTLPTIADTSPYQVPSMSSYLNDAASETSPHDPARNEDDSMSTAQKPEDSFEDELAAPYPTSKAKASSKPMVLVPGLNLENESSSGVDIMSEESIAMVPSQPIAARTTEEHDRLFTDELGSDDQDIGIPEDMYQPRPSRSRGRGRNQDEDLVVPTDFSKRPEAVSKKKQKNKRASDLETLDLNENNEDASETDFSANPSAPANNTVASPENQQAAAAAAEGPGEVNTLIKLVKKQRGRPRKSVEAKVDDEIERQVELISTKTDANASESAKGVTRGAKHVISDPDVDDNLEHGIETSDLKSNDQNQTVKTEESMALREINANSPKKSDNLSKGLDLGEPQTPDGKNSSLMPKGPAKHSPIDTKGAVKFRVGLSKRARIEPLLRIVRK